MIVGYTVTLSKVGNSYRVVIPKPACVGLQWNTGDKLSLSVEENKVTITKTPPIEERVSPPTATRKAKPSIVSKVATSTKIPLPTNTKTEPARYIPVEPKIARPRKKK